MLVITRCPTFLILTVGGNNNFFESLFNSSMFNKKLFKKSIFRKNPFLNQVFNKNFDSFFFLNFSVEKEFKGNSFLYVPHSFINNINDKGLFIDSTQNNKKLEYIFNNDWNVNDFIIKFKETIGNQKTLFWSSESEKWGMITDTENEVAIIGADWNIVDQIDLFFKDFYIPPNEFFKKIKLKNSFNSLLKNYKPKKILTIGDDKENPLWEKYFFECYVENEEDKIFYWKQFELFYDSLSKLLVNFKGKDMYADQGFWRQYLMNNSYYTTGKNAPVGGWQIFSHKNCKKVSTKFLPKNEHLILEFEGKMDQFNQMMRKSNDGLIRFGDIWVYGNIEKQKIKGQSSDFYFQTKSFGGKNSEVNQRLEITFNKSLIGNKYLRDFIEEIKHIGRVKKIYKVTTPKLSVLFSETENIKVLEINKLALNSNNPLYNLVYEKTTPNTV